MSKSYIKYPVMSYVGYNSNKFARSFTNRSLRRINKSKLQKEQETFEPSLSREVSDTWDFPSDGLPMYIKENSENGFYLELDNEIKRLLSAGFSVQYDKRSKFIYRIHCNDGTYCSGIEDLLAYYHLRPTEKTIANLTNKQIKEFARILWKKNGTK